MREQLKKAARTSREDSDSAMPIFDSTIRCRMLFGSSPASAVA
jgi:hypothetical protein